MEIITKEADNVIDEDIQHTVGRLFTVRQQQNNIIKGNIESTEEIVRKVLQAERNHWKERLQMSMHEIDRQHRVILTTQTGLQELVKSLQITLQKNVLFNEEDEEDADELDQEIIAKRLLENLKFQIRQLKVKAGLIDVPKTDFMDNQSKQKLLLSEMKGKIEKMNEEQNVMETQLIQKDEKINRLLKENLALHRQVTKLQKIVARYNEGHCGANFHLKLVESQSERKSSVPSIDQHENINTVTERTYIEGDQLVGYPIPTEENAIIKERLKKNIYSARMGDSRSSNVAQCLRCQALFKPSENSRRSCRYHHKGREIREQFHNNGKLEKVMYTWACCKRSLEEPGCCYGFHV